MKFSRAAIFASAVLAGTSFAAYGATFPIKEWTGTIDTGAGSTPITVTINNTNPTADSGLIKWGSPQYCTSKLQFFSQQNDEWVFLLRKGYGQFCNTISDGRAYVKWKSNTELQLRLTTPNPYVQVQPTTLKAPQ